MPHGNIDDTVWAGWWMPSRIEGLEQSHKKKFTVSESDQHFTKNRPKENINRPSIRERSVLWFRCFHTKTSSTLHRHRRILCGHNLWTELEWLSVYGFWHSESGYKVSCPLLRLLLFKRNNERFWIYFQNIEGHYQNIIRCWFHPTTFDSWWSSTDSERSLQYIWFNANSYYVLRSCIAKFWTETIPKYWK